MPNRSSRRKTNRLRRQNKKQDKKFTPADLDKLIDEFNQKATINNDGKKELKKFLVYTLERKLYGPDPTKEYVIFCLSSYFILRQHYVNLELIYDLLPIGLLKEESLNDLKFNAGVNDQVVQLIKIKTENYNEQNKVVVLVMEEICVHSCIGYDEKSGLNIGFEDNGKVRTSKLARFMTVIWINSVGGQWVLPFAYILTENSTSVEQIQAFLFESIIKLKEISLDVVGVATKLKANFYDLSEKLNISPTNQTFDIGGQKVVFLFDVPQLMNITRNNLIKYTFKFDDMETSWKYIEQFFSLENENKINKKTKLTNRHLKPDNKAKTIPRLAIEVLSNSVATEMKECITAEKLPLSAMGTAECIDFFDKLFDILNSQLETTINEYNSSFKGTKHQMKFMDKVIYFFENLKIYDKDEDCTDKIKFIKGWLITVKGFIKLWDIVKAKGHPYLLTRNINCESLDKFLNLLTIPLLNPVPLTAKHFVPMYKTLFVTSYFDEDNCPVYAQDCLDWDMDSYVKKVYNRIPSTKHNLKDTDEAPVDTSINLLNVFDTFIEEYSDMF